MIRFNDIDKTVIDVNSITGYSKNDDSIGINLILSSTREKFVEYNSYETRNIDIELLDKLFDIKNIEDKAMSVEKPTRDVNVMKPKIELVSELSGEESKLVSKGEDDPVKYLTWKDVKQYATSIKAEMPNGDIKWIWYKPAFGGYIDIADVNDDTRLDAIIYDEDLFNSLRLKEVR